MSKYLSTSNFRPFIQIETPHEQDKDSPNSKLNSRDGEWVMERLQDLQINPKTVQHSNTIKSFIEKKNMSSKLKQSESTHVITRPPRITILAGSIILHPNYKIISIFF